MREILFRGKRIDNGEFVYGYVGVFKGITQIFVPFTEEEEKENEGHFLSVIGGLWHTVNPETVGQFTGLTDKNGKKVFEGDIISSSWGYKGVVEFDSIMYAKLECLFNEDSEVTGNIHDNPELLEVDENG